MSISEDEVHMKITETELSDIEEREA